MPAVDMEPYEGDAPSRYVELGGDVSIYVARELYRSVATKETGIIVDFRRGKFRLDGASFKL